MFVAELHLYYPGAPGDGNNPFGQLAVGLGERLETALKATFPGMCLQAPRAWACDPDLFHRERPPLEVHMTVPTAFGDSGSLLNDTLVAATTVWRDVIAAGPAAAHLDVGEGKPCVIFLVDYRDIDKIVVRAV